MDALADMLIQDMQEIFGADRRRIEHALAARIGRIFKTNTGRETAARLFLGSQRSRTC